MAIFFTSDQHFFHRRVIEYCKRPFFGGLHNKFWTALTGDITWAAVREMNESMIKRHNAVVGPNDTVYHLGDFSLSKTRWREILHRLNGRHILIMGNHDACHPCHKQVARRFKREYLTNGFADVIESMEMHLVNERVTLQHMPFYNPNPDFDQRYPQYRPKNEGQFLLHGHVHEKWRVKGRMINVGVDVWNFTPVSLEQIETLIYTIKKEEEYNAIHKTRG